MTEIASRHNARFKTWLALLESKGIKAERRCLVSGPKIVAELLEQQAEKILEWILPPKAQEPAGGIPATRLTGGLFNELDVIGTKSPIAVVRCEALPKWTGGPPDGLNLIIALSDPHNVGALIRSAEAFGARGVILTKECASPFLPRAVRASSGSVFRMPLFSAAGLRELEAEPAFGLDLGGRDINDLEWPRDMYLVLGEEGQGLPADLNLTRVTIPIASAVESLNAVAAASVALYSVRQRRPQS